MSHINSVAQENNFLIMFAVIDKYQEAYRALAERITGSDVSLLEADGSNIIDIVSERYEEITTSIKVKENMERKRSFFGIKYKLEKRLKIGNFHLSFKNLSEHFLPGDSKQSTRGECNIPYQM